MTITLNTHLSFDIPQQVRFHVRFTNNVINDTYFANFKPAHTFKRLETIARRNGLHVREVEEVIISPR